MEIFRITLKEFSDKLYAPGFRGRWNQDGQYVIYAASSRSLACLENLVHRNQIPAEMVFSTMIIEVPEDIVPESISLKNLPANWLSHPGDVCPACLKLGSRWYNEKKSVILKVPSAVVPHEWNYVINTKHKDFERLKLKRTEAFAFDERFKL